MKPEQYSTKLQKIVDDAYDRGLRDPVTAEEVNWKLALTEDIHELVKEAMDATAHAALKGIRTAGALDATRLARG